MQRIIRIHKAFHIVQIARAMPPVMADIKRCIALWRWCQLWQATLWIECIVACRKIVVALDECDSRLGNHRKG